MKSTLEPGAVHGMQVDDTCPLELNLMRFVEAAVYFEILVVVNLEICSFAPFCQSSSQIVKGVPELWGRNYLAAYFVEH